MYKQLLYIPPLHERRDSPHLRAEKLNPTLVGQDFPQMRKL